MYNIYIIYIYNIYIYIIYIYIYTRDFVVIPYTMQLRKSLSKKVLEYRR